MRLLCQYLMQLLMLELLVLMHTLYIGYTMRHQIHLSDGKHKELSLVSATVDLKSLKSIVINPNFYNTDKEVCRFLVRRNVKHYKLEYNNLFRTLLIGSIGQVAISAL